MLVRARSAYKSQEGRAVGCRLAGTGSAECLHIVSNPSSPRPSGITTPTRGVLARFDPLAEEKTSVTD